jgi:hypothetical protein
MPKPLRESAMRNGYLLVSAIAWTLAACANGPISYLAATPQSSADAYSCAVRKVNELGYTITNTNKDAGFVTGTKQTSGLGTQFLTGSQYHDQLTISVFDQPNSPERQMRATTGRIDQRASLFGTSTTGVKPSSIGISDANAVLMACGKGTITQQTENEFVAVARRTVDFRVN